MLPYEYELINKVLKERGLEHLKSKYLYKRSYQEVIRILDLPEWNNPKFKHLFTSNIWLTNSENIKAILALKEWDNPLFKPLFTASIWNSNPDKIKMILELEEWNNPLFQKILTPNIWNSNYENVKAIITSKLWQDNRFKHLLSKSIWNKNIKKIEKVVETMIKLSLEDYITIKCLNLSPIQIRALYKYLINNKIDVILDNKLNPIFNASPTVLLYRYGINLKQLVEEEKQKEKNNGLSI